MDLDLSAALLTHGTLHRLCRSKHVDRPSSSRALCFGVDYRRRARGSMALATSVLDPRHLPRCGALKTLVDCI